ncbi:MAG: RIP metalloprotease RseP [Ignavibacteriae bacterium HGW-Ignavibacteriae-3]|nr:MAG: RIP metalloprotease RseP [Ignavibacteriae bacterium HGW-Ignavibacteriae-3]
MDYIIYFIITIGILVFVHEFGHFAAAKLSKMRVDVFAIGFGKRLFGYNKITGFTFGDLAKDFDGQGNTDYRLSLLPLGGYVKIAGMVDESFDTKFADSEPKPHEFRSKSTLAKLFVITAGVMMNLTLTLLIFWGINFFHGQEIAKSTTISAVENGSIAQQAGFQSFDKILSVNNVAVKDWQDVADQILSGKQTKDLELQIERNGIIQPLNLPLKFIKEHSNTGFFIYPYPTRAIVIDVMKNSPAQDAGLKSGDLILSLNSINIIERTQINDIIGANKDKAIQIVLLRDKDTVKTAVKPASDGLIGISHNIAYVGDKEYRTSGFFESIPQAVVKAKDFTLIFFKMMGQVFSGKLAFKDAFGGPVKIAQYAAISADGGGVPFLYFLAMLSLNLAIINILPFPVLDGGHFVIILLEGLFKRELPVKFKMIIQNIGFALLLLLMAFIIYNDVISL